MKGQNLAFRKKMLELGSPDILRRLHDFKGQITGVFRASGHFLSICQRAQRNSVLDD